LAVRRFGQACAGIDPVSGTTVFYFFLNLTQKQVNYAVYMEAINQYILSSLNYEVAR